MCLITWADRVHPGLPFVLLANRDELHARPSLAADWRAAAPPYLAGLDAKAGGSWLAYQPGGRLAAVTNVRQLPFRDDWRHSRGRLVVDWMSLGQDWASFAKKADAESTDTGPYNLLLRDDEALRYCGNRPAWHADTLTHGVHAVSNAALDTPWPKLQKITQAMRQWLQAVGDQLQAEQALDPLLLNPLFVLMRDTSPAPDEDLPDTGIGLERERLLSSPFIESESYGTRCTTLIIEWADGRWLFIERRFGPLGIDLGQSEYSGQI
ncbi:NRDE family protein [Pseudomarimonas arenosa]|uniref:NRDE family protein n=1 Tax=Pseudomarimonas arenosa TaxID=2774145 RepID=A0AAW3ZFU5_9GAMM|nr:NRDE family protein [Pseudomarimonas arenosa]MBD8524911.1 NRDE family protein [Pseudomarimonas arenosa]